MHSCIGRKDGKSGGDIKKITFDFNSLSDAKFWENSLKRLVYGGNVGLKKDQEVSSKIKSILVLVEKSDKDASKLIEKYAKEIFDIYGRPYSIKGIYFLKNSRYL